MVIVAVYDPAGKCLTFTEKVVVDEAPDASVPLVGVADNQLAEGFPMDQCNPSPPVLVMVIDCGLGLAPREAEKVRLFVLSSIIGGATLIVIAIIPGLPVTG